MSTKQIRISDTDQIRKCSPEYVGKHVNIVLSNSMVMSGILIQAGATEIILQNMRLEKKPYAFETITELYFDHLI